MTNSQRHLDTPPRVDIEAFETHDYGEGGLREENLFPREDGAPVIQRLPKAILDEILDDEPRHGNDVVLSTQNGYELLKTRDPEFEPPSMPNTYVDVQVDQQQVANMILQTGRASEFPDRKDRIMELANRDLVDMIQARKASEKMLESEPSMKADPTTNPSP